MKTIKTLLLLICFALTFSLVGCKKGFTPLAEDVKVINVAASAAPHAEILEAAKPLMQAKGYTLNVTIFEDYIVPNTSVEEGEMDANYFQHITYLNDFNAQNGTHLVSVGLVHYEPFGIYAGTKNDLSAIANGDTVIVPNDPTNEARALLLLQDLGWIKLKDGAGILATKADIVENKYNLNIFEVVSAQIPNVVKDGQFAVINGNYALQAINEGIQLGEALAYESTEGEAAEAYGNILCVREENKNHPIVKALFEVLTSEEIKTFITNKYKGSVLPL